jgi:hypothetical protein
MGIPQGVSKTKENMSGFRNINLHNKYVTSENVCQRWILFIEKLK